VNLTSLAFTNHLFPKLFRDYISGDSRIHTFFDGNPFSEDSLKSKISRLSFSGDRTAMVQLLRDFNSRFNASQKTMENIERLGEDKVYTVVTGQQLTLYGGPLFTIYKILTAIQISQSYEKKFNIKLVPVFWLADEDHDFDEIAALGIPASDHIAKLRYETEKREHKRVAEIELDEGFNQFKSDLNNLLSETDFSDTLWGLLDSFYKPGQKISDAFGSLVMKLFGKYGLVLAGSNSAQIKKLTSKVLICSVQQSDSILKTLKKTSDRLSEEGYPTQVLIQESNLFWIDDQGNRIKIHKEEGSWFTDDKTQQWTGDEIIENIKQSPNKFSPNVFLRPVLQDFLLPTFAYVGGPGEIAYYAQMKEFYKEFDLSIPLIIPRFSATIVESGIDRIMEKLPFSFNHYINRIDELESSYISQTDSPDLEALFSSWKEEIELLTESMKKRIAEIDPTLEGTAGKASATYFTELDKLKGKLYRSIKQKEETQLNRIAKIKHHLFPESSLQEREVAFIYFMNKYGPDIWDNMLHLLQDEISDTHKVFVL
jgi:bacillithiol synthase